MTPGAGIAAAQRHERADSRLISRGAAPRTGTSVAQSGWRDWSSRIAASFVCLLGMAAASCATNPATGKKEITLMTEQQELELGRQAAAEVERQMPAYQDDRLQRYVSDIGMRLARASERPRLPWQFTVVDASAVNAFAPPGGSVYITRGILPYLNDEAELAGVRATRSATSPRATACGIHEAVGRRAGLLTLGIFVPSAYPFTGLGSSALGVFFLKYSRDDEIEADRLGVGYSADQGWDPHGVANMLTTLSRLDEATDRRASQLALTHPQPEARVERVSATVKTQIGAPGLTTNRDDYLQRLDGMIFGDDPDDGIVRDNVSASVDAALVEFPLDWPINNGKEQVVAKNPSADEHGAADDRARAGTLARRSRRPSDVEDGGSRAAAAQRR
jgi:predicted Zn-dependent protease